MAPTDGVLRPQSDFMWNDREVRFDISPSLLACHRGEKIIDSINSVEDTKGNNGERGSLIVTNLRLLWVCHSSSKINLSVGLNTVISANIKSATSALRGRTQALCIIAKFNSRFEFIFTSLVKNSPRLFTTVQAVLRAYETSKLYRDLKLRGSIMRDNELMLLAGEQIFSRITGVWNLSSEQGSLGVFFITNVRIVWHANLAANFNVSLPYLQMRSVRIRDSKFGVALVLETFSKSGGYMLGFRVDPQERTDEVYNQISSLFSVYSATPNFGLDFTVEATPPDLAALIAAPVREDTELLDEEEDAQAIAAYYAENGDAANIGDLDSRIQYEPSIGLAVEAMPNGLSLEHLWRVI